jgi:hypothetical protein
MRLPLLAISLLASTIIFLPASAQKLPADAFKDVPTTSWAYHSLDDLSKKGIFTGYPDGTFDGHRALTRYEFGVALARTLASVQAALGRMSVGEAPLLAPPAATTQGALFRAIVRKYNVRCPKWEDGAVLCRLVREFSPELRLLGHDTGRINLAPLEPPSAETLVPARPVDETKRQRDGRGRARREWKEGQVYLDGGGCNAWGDDPLLGIPWRASGPQPEAYLQETAAHNDEVFRLTLERGWPPNSRRRSTEPAPVRSKPIPARIGN